MSAYHLYAACTFRATSFFGWLVHRYICGWYGVRANTVLLFWILMCILDGVACRTDAFGLPHELHQFVDACTIHIAKFFANALEFCNNFRCKVVVNMMRLKLEFGISKENCQPNDSNRLNNECPKVLRHATPISYWKKKKKTNWESERWMNVQVISKHVLFSISLPFRPSNDTILEYTRYTLVIIQQVNEFNCRFLFC